MPIAGYFAESFDKMTDAQIEASLKSMGLTDPLHVQLGRFYKNLSQFNL